MGKAPAGTCIIGRDRIDCASVRIPPEVDVELAFVPEKGAEPGELAFYPKLAFVKHGRKLKEVEMDAVLDGDLVPARARMPVQALFDKEILSETLGGLLAPFAWLEIYDDGNVRFALTLKCPRGSMVAGGALDASSLELVDGMKAFILLDVEY